MTRHKSKLHTKGKPQVVVEVKISSQCDSDGFAPHEILKALVDTGASRTAICRSALEKIQADEVGVTKIRSYGSAHDLLVSTYCLNLMVLREDLSDFVEICGLDVVPFLEGQDYDMLLGMDVLSQFKKIEIEHTDITFYK
ncbi:MAG: aspartyl protease family protein [Candidatus Nanopelagicaceae bacterium]